MKRFLVFTATSTLLIGVNLYLWAQSESLLTVNSSGFMPLVLVLTAMAFGFLPTLLKEALSVFWVRAKGAQQLSVTGSGGWIINETEQFCRELNIKPVKVAVEKTYDIDCAVYGLSSRNALIVISTGLLNTLSLEQVRAILAHELTHVKNKDNLFNSLYYGLFSTLALVVARTLTYSQLKFSSVAAFIFIGLLELMVVSFFAFILAKIVRESEFKADKGGANLVGEENMATALLAMQMTELLTKKSFIEKFLAHHPPYKARIKKMQAPPKPEEFAPEQWEHPEEKEDFQKVA